METQIRMEEIQRLRHIAAAEAREAARSAIRRMEESQEEIRMMMAEMQEARRRERRRERLMRVAELASPYPYTWLAEGRRAGLLRESENEIRRERGASKAAIEKLEVVADYGLDRSGEDCCSICLAE
ncbi:hypothetical protein LINGRAHAP2_LOCUS35948, partial [Linum grandiflorum]